MAARRCCIAGGALLLLLLCGARAERTVLATTDCTKLHPQCTSCAKTTINGASVLSCKTCTAPAYAVSPNKLSCACTPGYYAPSTAAKTCIACPKGSFCTGLAVQPVSCGAYLTTASTNAASAAACITRAGAAYFGGIATAQPCRVGAYSAGGNQRNCTGCPSGLTTTGTGSTSIDACKAPSGYYYLNRQALPCPKGTYKSGINQASACDACPDGLTTRYTNSTSLAACSLATPGFQPTLINGVVTGAEECPLNTYSPAGVACITCPGGLQTQTTKCISAVSCLAPPGYGYYANGIGDGVVTTAMLTALGKSVIACPAGSFKGGWNKLGCVSCGAGFLTETEPGTPAVSADQCYIPPGWGSKRTSTGQLVAKKCLLGTYGQPDNSYGQTPVPCTPCPENTATPDMNPAASADDIAALVLTASDNCTALPGYGWSDGLVDKCPLGTWGPGFELALGPCAQCGAGLTTATTGSSSSAQCIALPGWALSGQAEARPCTVGEWGAGGLAQCTPCATGSTTAADFASSAAECSICLLGYGGDGNSACVACDVGTYSHGGSDAPCTPCSTGMTSAARASDPSDCFDAFSALAPYDLIATPASALVQAASVLGGGVAPPDNAADCEGVCGSDVACQHYQWRQDQEDEADNGCYLKQAPATPDANTFLAFKLGVGDYTVWRATAADASLGASTAWAPSDASPVTPDACLDACDGLAGCLAFHASLSGSAWACRLVHGDLANGVTSKVRAAPAQINHFYWV